LSDERTVEHVEKRDLWPSIPPLASISLEESTLAERPVESETGDGLIDITDKLFFA